MTHLNDNTPTDHCAVRDDRSIASAASQTAVTLPATGKGRLRLAFKRPAPAERAYEDRLCQLFFITGISVLLGGCGVWWCSHWLFGEILSPQYPDPQAARVMAIWNVLMYFVPGAMIFTGAALAFVPAVLAVARELLTGLTLTRRKPAQN